MYAQQGCVSLPSCRQSCVPLFSRGDWGRWSLSIRRHPVGIASSDDEHSFETAAGRLRRICCSCRVHQSRAFEVVAVFGERCLPVSVSGYLDGAVCGSASFRWEQESPLCPAQHRVLPRYVGQPAEGRTEPLLLAAGQPVHLRAGTLHYYHTSLSGVLDGFSIFLCRPRPTIYLIDFTFYNYHYCCW